MKLTQLKTPNDEQRPAIEHEGGILLSAGAGSGKTFVLVEHAIFLVQSFFQKNSFPHQENYQAPLKSYLSQIVYMTFTNKATGELSIRIKNRFEMEILQAREGKSILKLWQAEMSFRALKFLTVTTIHGFCFKLIQRGYFSSVNSNQEIIGSIEFKDKIKILFEKWFVLKEKSIDRNVKEVLILNRSFLHSALMNIFSTPEIRILWRELDIEKVNQNFNENMVKNFFLLLGVQDIQERWPDFENFEQKKKPSWSIRGDLLFQEIKKVDFKSYTAIFELEKIFNQFGRMPQVSKSKVPSDIYSFYQKAKKIREFVKSYRDDLIAYVENESTYFYIWAKTIKDLYCFIEKNYHTVSGLTFSDLEYFVFSGLRDKYVCTKIHQQYKYFIVDEFQDTSKIQFKILSKILREDYSKLFCVGDMKQAIYGFRGGELNVFKSYSNKASKNLSLNYNYRSCKEIIQFNNSMFEDIFSQAGEENKHFSKPQKYPKYDLSGYINKYDINISASNIKRLNAEELNWIEAREIFKFIEKKLRNGILNLCILYKQLMPLKFLLPLLIQKKISFTCQVKVKLEEDPLLYFYFNLLSPFVSKDFDKAKSKCIQLGKIIIEILKGDTKNETNTQFEDFYINVPILGLWEAFKKLLFELGIHNSNYENNLNLIYSFCAISDDNILNILKDIKLFKRKYSVEIRFGTEFERIRIMTVHASKGLEFDHVILAGIHTNGRTYSHSPPFGQRPLSFKWKKGTEENIFYKSPEYIYEILINKEKENAESRRLFYVACTRAKMELTWFDIKLNQLPQSVKNSWIEEIRFWEKENNLSSLIHLEKIEITKDWENKNISQQENLPPLFHRDSLGLYLKSKLKQNKMIILPKLSVTKLLLLTECPRKFYFKNILEISDLEKTQKNYQGYISTEKNKGLSSGARGELIHNSISFSLRNNFKKQNGLKEKRDNQAVAWALDELKLYNKTHQFVSEEEIRFPFFNFMISGKPDLVLLNNNKQVSEIWDFKTGAISPIKNPGYWFQLMSYAYGFYQLDKIDFNKKIKLVLCFVDKKHKKVKESSFLEISKSLYSEWKKLDSLEKKNEVFCPTCSYGNLCHPR